MPKPFFGLTPEQFFLLLDTYPLTRSIEAVHMHHTWLPNRNMYTGLTTIEGIYQNHVGVRGFIDLAEHITIAPDGTIWTGRDWNLPPASATGFNGNAHAGPFMFETIGDFDRGQDPFDGVQRETVLRVLVRLLARFNLPLEQIRFHNQMTNAKTCPGTGIDRGELLQTVAALQGQNTSNASGASAPAASAGGTADLALVAQVIASMTKPLGASGRALEDGELDYDLAARTAFFTSAIPNAGSSRDLGGASAGRTAAQLQTLRPYAINMRWGMFAEGEGHVLQTSPGDVDAIVQQHLPAALAGLGDGETLDILLYAHGGLVSESDGLQEAYTALDFFQKNKVYPIFFIWETGFWETVQGLITGKEETETRDLIGVADAVRNKTIEYAAHYVLQGPRMWGGMKWDADRSSAQGGAALYFAQGLASFTAGLGEKRSRVRVHASGHSAGAIFHSYLLPVLFELGLERVDTFHLLAPAIRVDSYQDRLEGLLRSGQIADTTIYTMLKQYELADTCKRIYGHSLLYLIRNALEDKIPTPILGLEECLRADAGLAGQFGLAGTPNPNTRILWSPTTESTGLNATQCICHGGFHNDPATMGSLVRRVKHWTSDAPVNPFPDLGNICPDAGKVRSLQLRAAAAQPSAGGGSRWEWSGSRAVTPNVSTRSGRRVALCIGIDQYPAPNTLSGCVADAYAWRDALGGLGFDVQTLTDAAASYNAMVESMTDLIRSASAGDTLVLQYSGHGTEVANPDRQAGDGELAAQDEAFVPVDFMDTGGFLIDRQVRSIFAQLASEVQLTCFVDCCHSATISRMAIGAAPPPAARDVRARFVPFTLDMARAYRGFQGARGLSSTSFPPGLRSDMRHVVFSACKAEEVAYERNGRGDFSRLSIPLLGTPSLSNAEFQARVVQAFGAGAAQHPVLDCADGWTNRPLFAFGGSAVNGGSGLGSGIGAPGFAGNARELGLPDLARRLRGLADLIG